MGKIALLGSAPSSKDYAPFDDPEWEIWCCSPPNYQAPRVDAWFELHHLDRKIAAPGNGPYIETLKKHPRVYFSFPDKRFPKALIFPWGELVEEYGPWFFSSSVAWMFAFALEYAKPEKIGLWGIDMSAAEEYGYQRAGLHFFIREALNKGIEVKADPRSDILQAHPLYAIKEHWPQWKKHVARRKELKQRLSIAESAIENASNDAMMLRGALDDLQYHENTWIQPNWLESFNEPVRTKSDVNED